MNDQLSTYQSGLKAEKWACWLLRLKGYRILEQRFKTPYGEIDLIAKRGKKLIFVEVKHRPHHDIGLHAITTKAQERIANAARLYLARHLVYADHEMRFDAVIVSPRRMPLHLRGAWISK